MEHLKTIYDKSGEVVAYIDRCCIDYTTVILVDSSKPYVEKFFIDDTDEELIEKTKLLRKLNEFKSK